MKRSILALTFAVFGICVYTSSAVAEYNDASFEDVYFGRQPITKMSRAVGFGFGSTRGMWTAEQARSECADTQVQSRLSQVTNDQSFFMLQRETSRAVRTAAAAATRGRRTVLTLSEKAMFCLAHELRHRGETLNSISTVALSRANAYTQLEVAIKGDPGLRRDPAVLDIYIAKIRSTWAGQVYPNQTRAMISTLREDHQRRFEKNGGWNITYSPSAASR